MGFQWISWGWKVESLRKTPKSSKIPCWWASGLECSLAEPYRQKARLTVCCRHHFDLFRRASGFIPPNFSGKTGATGETTKTLTRELASLAHFGDPLWLTSQPHCSLILSTFEMLQFLWCFAFCKMFWFFSSFNSCKSVFSDLISWMSLRRKETSFCLSCK